MGRQPVILGRRQEINLQLNQLLDAVLLVVSYVDHGATAWLITLFVVCLFAVLWFVLPLVRSRTRFPS